MFPILRTILLFCVIFDITSSRVWCQKQPQDSFFLEKTISSAPISITNPSQFSITVDASNRCYITTGSAIYVYDVASGANLTNWAVSGIRGITYDPISNVVVCSSTTSPQIRFYDMQFQLLSSWGTNALSKPESVGVGPDGLLYISDFGGVVGGNNVVWVYTRSGSYVRSWNPGGRLAGLSVSATDGSVFTMDANPSGTRPISKFDPMGALISGTMPTASGLDWEATPAVSADGILAAGCANNFYIMAANDYTLCLSQSLGLAGGAAFSPSGDKLFLLFGNSINVYSRCYRTAGTKPLNAIPLPNIWNTAQRSGTAWIDADFIVSDADNTNVACAAYAIIGGQSSLFSFVPMRTLLTNDAGLVSLTNVSTGIKHHLVWDAGTDWPTRYGYIKIAMMARDNRNLLDTHFITIPTNANPAFTFSNVVTISQSPFQDSDFLNVWYWLICTDPSVNLTNGNVYSTVDNYGVTNGARLALTTISGTTNTTTTADGRTFIFSMMSSNLVGTVYSNKVIRGATTNEINQAKVGTTGNLTNVVKWTPRVQINGLPKNVNALGFDTGWFGSNASIPTNVWWIVLTPASP
jgi:hypothetical protein